MIKPRFLPLGLSIEGEAGDVTMTIGEMKFKLVESAGTPSDGSSRSPTLIRTKPTYGGSWARCGLRTTDVTQSTTGDLRFLSFTDNHSVLPGVRATLLIHP